MTHDWVLVETLGNEPAVVAEGAYTKNLIPISTFLRRNPHLMAIQTAIGETVRAGKGLSSITSKNDRVIRTEVVQMSDGRIHGVHVWVGTPEQEPLPRPLVGPLIWDLAQRTATDTPESLQISGWDPERETTQGRAFADDLPRRDLNPNEADGPQHGDQAGGGRHDLQHLGRHRSPGRTDHRRIRRAGAVGGTGRRQGAADLPGDELAQRPGWPEHPGGPPRPTDPGQPCRTGRAPGTGRSDGTGRC